MRREETTYKLRKKPTLNIAGKNKKGAFKKIMLIFPGKAHLRKSCSCSQENKKPSLKPIFQFLTSGPVLYTAYDLELFNDLFIRIVLLPSTSSTTSSVLCLSFMIPLQLGMYLSSAIPVVSGTSYFF